MFAMRTKTPTDTVCLNDASGKGEATPFIVEQKRTYNLDCRYHGETRKNGGNFVILIVEKKPTYNRYSYNHTRTEGAAYAQNAAFCAYNPTDTVDISVAEIPAGFNSAQPPNRQNLPASPNGARPDALSLFNATGRRFPAPKRPYSRMDASGCALSGGEFFFTGDFGFAQSPTGDFGFAQSPKSTQSAVEVNLITNITQYNPITISHNLKGGLLCHASLKSRGSRLSS
jgi:hypothetical protein